MYFVPKADAITEATSAFSACSIRAVDKFCHEDALNPNWRKNAAFARPAGWLLDRRYDLTFRSSTAAK
jgi:hypothetical protein